MEHQKANTPKAAVSLAQKEVVVRGHNTRRHHITEIIEAVYYFSNDLPAIMRLELVKFACDSMTLGCICNSFTNKAVCACM